MRSRRWTMLALWTLLGVAGAACGDDGGGATPDGLLPFADVQASDFSFEADPTDPSRGIFRVTTTEPMICAIVWGETDAFGRFNNSLAMNGTGIVDHDVVLPEIVPGTTYTFRVQGTTADGRQFRSDVGTFVIPEIGGGGATVEPPDGENLALGATVVAASSSFGTGWEPENALDGDLGTEWATRGDGDEGFLTIDLGATREITAIEFVTRSMADGSAITETYTVTADGGEAIGPFPSGNPANPRPVDVELTGRELRFAVDASSGGNVGAIEVRVYGPG